MVRAPLALVLAASLGGCSVELDHPPTRPGGGGRPGGMAARPDGGTEPDAGGSGFVAGRVCPILDLRFPAACDPLQNPALVRVEEDVSGNVVTSGGEGAFSVASEGARALLIIGGNDPARRDSLIPVELTAGSASDVNAPVITADDHDGLTLTLGVVEPDDTASIVAYVRSAGLPEQGAEVVPPEASTDTFYDDDDGSGVAGWDPLGQTESAGAVVMFGVPVIDGFADFLVVNSDATIVKAVTDVPVAVGATSFVRVNLDQP